MLGENCLGGKDRASWQGYAVNYDDDDNKLDLLMSQPPSAFKGAITVRLGREYSNDLAEWYLYQKRPNSNQEACHDLDSGQRIQRSEYCARELCLRVARIAASLHHLASDLPSKGAYHTGKRDPYTGTINVTSNATNTNRAILH